MGNDFSVQSLKVKSKMASQRMTAHIGKKENQLVKTYRMIAKLLLDGKEQSARIKVEGVLREEGLCRVMEWLQMMCDLIHQRIKQIEIAKECPEDLTESICTILYCAKRVDIAELSEIGGLFKAKWGPKWFEANIENRSGRVSKKIIEKLSPEPPTREAVIKKLKQIADDNDIEWEPGQEEDEEMPAIVGHRNEYTVEFVSKPFGMEWTATEDGLNLWVSNVTPMSQAARNGVMPGCMLIALNGINITNLGAPSIHDKAASLGLPLRVTFRKPMGMEMPTNKKDFSVNPQTVNKCVTVLKDPCHWELSDSQRTEMCLKNGANAAEAAAAIFLAKHMISNLSQQQSMNNHMQMNNMNQMNNPNMNQMNMNQMNQMNMNQQFNGPSNSDFPNQMSPVNNNNNNLNQPFSPPPNTSEPPPTEQSNPNNTLSDLEQRFANLKKGL